MIYIPCLKYRDYNYSEKKPRLANIPFLAQLSQFPTHLRDVH